MDGSVWGRINMVVEVVWVPLHNYNYLDETHGWADFVIISQSIYYNLSPSLCCQFLHTVRCKAVKRGVYDQGLSGREGSFQCGNQDKTDKIIQVCEKCYAFMGMGDMEAAI